MRYLKRFNFNTTTLINDSISEMCVGLYSAPLRAVQRMRATSDKTHSRTHQMRQLLLITRRMYYFMFSLKIEIIFHINSPRYVRRTYCITIRLTILSTHRIVGRCYFILHNRSLIFCTVQVHISRYSRLEQ